MKAMATSRRTVRSELEASARRLAGRVEARREAVAAAGSSLREMREAQGTLEELALVTSILDRMDAKEGR